MIRLRKFVCRGCGKSKRRRWMDTGACSRECCEAALLALTLHAPRYQFSAVGPVADGLPSRAENVRGQVADPTADGTSWSAPS